MANQAKIWGGERPRAPLGVHKKCVGCWDFAHALLELAVWLQAGEDRAIAAGSRAD
jgi:hypothetical protein